MRAAAAIGSVIVLAAAVVIAVVVSTDPADPPGTGGTQPVETSLVSVIRTDLIQTETLDGELRFSDPGSLVTQRGGIVTWLPEEGETVGVDDVAYELDGSAVVVMEGDRPSWRAFADGMDSGPDVLQLESNLARLGHTGPEFEVDDEFDEETAAAIESWQESTGSAMTGVIPLGSVVFAPGPFRVGAVTVTRGAPVAAGVQVYATSGLDQEIVVELDPGDLDLVAVGDAVTCVLPDGSEISGEIGSIGRVVRSSGPQPDAPETVEVVVAIDRTEVDLERAPVEVEVERDRASAVLAVPVRAIVSLSDGGYAVEIDQEGTRSLVGVSIGDFSGGLVEVEGPIREGDLVVVPVG